jgi:shikimate dehydrogenase
VVRPAQPRYADVVGVPVGPCPSTIIYRYWIVSLKLTCEYRARRVLFNGLEVCLGSLSEYLDSVQDDPNWLGCNVAAPFQEAAAAVVDRLDPIASALGSVSLIVPDNKQLVGRNSDAAGFMEPLWAGVERSSPRRAMLIGVGGPARMIAHALARAGFRLDIFGAEAAPALRLLKELGEKNGHRLRSLAQGAVDQERCGLLVNTTAVGVNGEPIGMKGAMPLTLRLEELSPRSIVYDTELDLDATPLLTAASRRGFATVSGLEMLLNQSATSFEALFGVPAPRQFDNQLKLLLVP